MTERTTDRSPATPTRATGPDPAGATWPLRERAARPVVPALAGAVGAAAATAVPLDRPGLGWLLAGAAGAGALGTVAVTATPRPGEDSGRWTGWRSIGWERAGWGVATLALLGVGALRAAGWLFALCLLAAVVSGSLAVGRARTPLGLFFAVTTVPVAAARGLGWLGRGVAAGDARRGAGPASRPPAPGSLAVPPAPGSAGTGGARPALQPGGLPGWARVATAAAVSLLLVVVFGALFAAADPAFARLVGSVRPGVDGATAARWILLFPAASVSVTAGAFLLVNPARLGDVTLPPPRPLRRVEWVLPVGALAALFALFVGVQLAVLFGDDAYVQRTAGLTFAQYARRGFWQLLTVTVLTLAVLAVAVRKAPSAGHADRVLQRVLLGALAGCTLVIVASALWRMWVYEQAYGFTRLRVTVSAFELWLGILFGLVLVAGVRLRAPWLPRAAVATGLAVLLGLVAVDPDRFIAAENVERYQRTGSIDVRYLRGLSADAAVEIDRLPSPLRECALVAIAGDLRDRDGWTEYNAGRAAARAVALPEPGALPPGCR